MHLPAETTVLMFEGYEQIPSHIFCYEFCSLDGIQVESSVFL